MPKACSICKIEKTLSEFAFKNKSKRLLQSRCKECDKKYKREYHKKTYEPKPIIYNTPKIPSDVLIDEEDREVLEKQGRWNVCKKSGYARMTRNNKSISMHRHIWQNKFGTIPDGMQIDHINGNRLDNRKDNLRLVTNQENQWNQRKAKGCHWNNNLKKWIATIGVNGKLKHLGCFDSEEEARNAYLEAKLVYHIIPERNKNDSNSI